MDKEKQKKIIIAVVAVVAVIAIAVGIFFGVRGGKNNEPETEAPASSTTEAPVVIRNPLTGEGNYNESAVGKRPIAVVVENAPGARPQYNITSPDIIVEGEVEGGETRMLWLYADMTALPEMVGPTRSARPSYVKFSELFDSVFVHFGGSHSKGDYTGGYETIEADGVDNLDGIKLSANFKRTSDKKSPHNAVLLGKTVVEAIDKKGYRKDVKDGATQLQFNETLGSVSTNKCESIEVKFSNRTKSHTFTYNADKGIFANQGDFKTPVEFTNIVVLKADSTYITKQDYKQKGQSETYLNYSLTSGTGTLASAGTTVDFTWAVENGALKLTDANGAPLKLNPGKTWIGLASSNHEGQITIATPEPTSVVQ